MTKMANSYLFVFYNSQCNYVRIWNCYSLQYANLKGDSMPEVNTKTVEQLLVRVAQLEDRCNLLGKQVTQIKDLYNTISTEIKILKEGGNL